MSLIEFKDFQEPQTLDWSKLDHGPGGLHQTRNQLESTLGEYKYIETDNPHNDNTGSNPIMTVFSDFKAGKCTAPSPVCLHLCPA